jgi:hypothetical protein
VGTEDQKLGYFARLIVSGFGTALVFFFALSVYASWAINGKYFHDYGWPLVGWGNTLWLIGAPISCLLAV